MSNYVYRSNLSYFDYLQAKSFEDSFCYEIKKNTRSIIASHEELQSEHIEISRNISNNIVDGFEQLSFRMEGIVDEIKELTSSFEWGFSELLSQLGHIDDTLQELLKVAKTPSQIWAYEQFEIARDAYRRGLHDEALECLKHAIEGYGTYTGYRLEYRFHFLLGTIRLGSFKNYSTPIVDLGEAKKAFLISAKYAKHDKPIEAGRAFLCAGWAAYSQGIMTEAKEFTKKAITLYPALGEARFQLAKILMHCGEPDKALVPLKQAIEIDRKYSLKASSDGDFKAYNKSVDSLILQLCEETRKKTENALVVLEKNISELEKFHVQELSVQQYTDVNKIKTLYKQNKELLNFNTYFGCTDALSSIMQTNIKIKESKKEFLDLAIVDVKRRLGSIDKKSSSELNELDCLYILILFYWIPLCAILSVIVPLMVEGPVFFKCLKISMVSIILICIVWIVRRIKMISFFKQTKLQLPKLLSDLQQNWDQTTIS